LVNIIVIVANDINGANGIFLILSLFTKSIYTQYIEANKSYAEGLHNIIDRAKLNNVQFSGKLRIDTNECSSGYAVIIYGNPK